MMVKNISTDMIVLLRAFKPYILNGSIVPFLLSGNLKIVSAHAVPIKSGTFPLILRPLRHH